MHTGELQERSEMAGKKHNYEKIEMSAAEMCGSPPTGACSRCCCSTRVSPKPALPRAPPPHTQTAYSTSFCLTHMKDKSLMYNLSKLYTHTYDSSRE